MQHLPTVRSSSPVWWVVDWLSRTMILLLSTSICCSSLRWRTILVKPGGASELSSPFTDSSGEQKHAFILYQFWVITSNKNDPAFGEFLQFSILLGSLYLNRKRSRTDRCGDGAAASGDRQEQRSREEETRLQVFS